jgi:DNA polymerase-3 subunit beta
MQLKIQREHLLKPLQAIVNVTDRRHTMPILANIMLDANANNVSITGTDLEAELIAKLPLLEPVDSSLKTTISAKKLLDICRVAPEETTLTFKEDNNIIKIRVGGANYTLATLSAEGFPYIDWNDQATIIDFTLPQSVLRELINSTYFAIAQQDTRPSLNGMLFEIKNDTLRNVTSDGHRLAINGTKLENIMRADVTQAIVPRKSIVEIFKLLPSSNKEDVQIKISKNHVRFIWPNVVFTSKLIDSKFPDYERNIPKSNDKSVLIDTTDLLNALGRLAILSNDLFCAVQFNIKPGQLELMTWNQEQEKAEELIPINYQGSELKVNFNIKYLQDILTNIKTEKLSMQLKDAFTSVIVKEHAGNHNNVHVLMPLCV